MDTPNPDLNGTEPAMAVPAAEGDSVHDDLRFGYRHIRYAASPQEQSLNESRSSQTWGHARPNSVFVAAIGHHWTPGSWAAIQDMVMYTNQHGYFCAFEEMMDRCFNPYDSLGTMRNEAILRASQGFEYLLMVDNDIFPRPEDLVRLVDRDVAISAPVVLEPVTGKPLHGPTQTRYTGLQPVRWAVLSMLLFKTSVFHATGPMFWSDAIGADEGVHFQQLWHYGHRPYLDTDIVLSIANAPTYPLATNRMTKEDADDFWNRRAARFLEVPDRSPVDPNDKRVSDLNEYMPFMVPEVGTATVNPAAPEILLPARDLSKARELVLS